MSHRRPVFDAIRIARGKGFVPDEVKMVDVLLDRLQVPRDEDAKAHHKVNAKALKLMHDFEGCKLDAYPDPGSRDGNPWTIGRGATGPGIAKGVRWTQEQADARFEQDVNRFASGVAKLLGSSPTTSDQFSALVSFAYNVGLNALGNSTLLRMHKAGDYAEAAKQFMRWDKNDGKIMRGLTRRRDAERKLYEGKG